ncbi:helix-turn-helix transcriptional regulator [Ruegeria sp.]|uniref:helix-turn-helix domain-containing protein n=1 Tax=Ruegeria sp. TaxID=1879320 RepID=UPI00231DA90C|nr:helix-turn-helix transcriptional regulator [Ruegeria sp.]MDA7965423.1 helix-turn-helix domain-containing protein [Ruegeria sp.]
MSHYKFKKKTKAEREAREEAAAQALDEAEAQHIADIESGRYEYRLARLQPHVGLKKLRLELGLSQAKMAEIAGVTRRTYQAYERGENPIPSDVLCRLAATFLFDMHMLFSGRTHSDNLKVREDTARLAVDVINHLKGRKGKFSGMLPHEAQQIAMEFARKNKPGTPVDKGTTYEAIRVVTGDKYIPDEIPYSAVAEWEPEDFPTKPT